MQYKYGDDRGFSDEKHAIEEDFGDYNDPEPQRYGGRNQYNDGFLDDSHRSSFSDIMPAADAPMERNSDLLKDLTDFDSYIRELVNGWLGMHWDQAKGAYTQNPHAEPLMNERCAVWCTTYLRTYVRKNNILTYIRQEEYKNFIKDIIDVVWLNIGTRMKEFGIKSNGDVLRICTEMEHACELMLMGAGGGKYTELLGGVYKRNEGGLSTPNKDPDKMGILQKTKNWLLG